MKKRTLLTLLLGFSCAYIFAVDFGGEVSSHHGWQSKEANKTLINNNQFLLEMEHDENSNYFFTSVKGKYNNITDENELELKEAYFDYLADSWDFRFGRQLIIWGKADGLRITDIICPMDYSFGSGQDLEDMRIPVDAFKFGFYPECFDLDLIFLPSVTKNIYPPSSSLWNVYGYSKVVHNLPKENLESSQVAGRMGKNFGFMDVAVSGAYVWLPVQSFYQGSLLINYKRSSFVGLEASTSMGHYVFRFESAYYERNFFKYGTVEKPRADALLGVDWYPGNNWTVIAQLEADLVCDYSKDVGRDESESTATLTLKKKLFREQLELSNQIVNSLANRDFFCRTQVDYDFSGGLHILLGYDYYDGSKSETFGKFADNSMMWCKAKYSF